MRGIHPAHHTRSSSVLDRAELQPISIATKLKMSQAGMISGSEEPSCEQKCARSVGNQTARTLRQLSLEAKLLAHAESLLEAEMSETPQFPLRANNKGNDVAPDIATGTFRRLRSGIVSNNLLEFDTPLTATEAQDAERSKEVGAKIDCGGFPKSVRVTGTKSDRLKRYAEEIQAIRAKAMGARKEAARTRVSTPILTSSLKRDLQTLQMRRFIYTKSFYKKMSKDDHKKLPSNFEVGTLVAGAFELPKTANILKKKKCSGILNEMLSDASFRKKTKRRFVASQGVKAEGGKAAYKKFKLAKRETWAR
jgi:hypothetical protein